MVQNGHFWSKWNFKSWNSLHHFWANSSVSVWCEWFIVVYWALSSEKIQVFGVFMNIQGKFQNRFLKMLSVWPKMPWKCHISTVWQKSMKAPCEWDSGNNPLWRRLQSEGGSRGGLRGFLGVKNPKNYQKQVIFGSFWSKMAIFDRFILTLSGPLCLGVLKNIKKVIFSLKK